MLNVRLASAGALFLFVLNGCGDSVPSCSDSDVKNLVIELSEKEILPYVTIKEKNGEKLTYGKADMLLLMMMGPDFKIKKTATKENHKLWDNIEKAQKEAKIKLKDDIRLTSILTNSKNKIAKKTECSAEIEHPDIQSYRVDYSAQYTEDNQVVVEIK